MGKTRAESQQGPEKKQEKRPAPVGKPTPEPKPAPTLKPMGRMRSRPIARLRYNADTPAHLLHTAIFAELMRFCQEGRVSIDSQKIVVRMWTEELEDREMYGDNYEDWEGSYRARHGVEPTGTEEQN